MTNFRGPMLIVAGAGTGKTGVITHRIAHMLCSGIKPRAIVAMTFTNKAAREMQARITALCGGRPDGLFVGTFHGYCLNLLRGQSRGPGGERKDLTIVDQSEQIRITQAAIDELGWNATMRGPAVHAAISRAKNALHTPDDVDASGDATVAAVYRQYQKMLKLYRAMDFDDCLFMAFEALSSGKLQMRLHREIDFVVVDEFQDTNLAQLTVLRQIVHADNNVCAVGDDDQSIYSWRGACTDIFTRYEELFPPAHVVKFEQNYRCSQQILGAANAVIKNNSARKDKTLWTNRDGKGPVQVQSFLQDREEAMWISERIMAARGRGAKFSDVAILYRASAQAREIELALASARIPFVVYGGQSLFDRKEVKDFLAALRLIAHQDDVLALWRLLGMSPYSFRSTHVERVANAATETSTPAFTLLLNKQAPLSRQKCEAGVEFCRAVLGFSERTLDSPAALREMAIQLIDVLGLTADARATSKDAAQRERKVDSLRRMPETVYAIAEDALARGKRVSLQHVIDSITLVDCEGDDERKRDAVSLMTIHAAKGLEFQMVFFCGLIEGLIPHRNSIGSGKDLQEERRLFYVALTRAREELFLTHFTTRKEMGSLVNTEPSRFLRELPADLAAVAPAGGRRLLPTKESSLAGIASIRQALMARSGVSGT